MSGALGNLLIKLMADTGEATSDIGKAAHLIERDMKHMMIVANAAGQVIGQAFDAIGRAAFNAGKEALMLGDQLNKMSQRTGLAVERLSEIAFAGELADVSLGQVGQGLAQFNKNLVEAARDGSKAAEMFKALGVDISAGPQAAFDQMAKAINSLPDGELKATAMRAAFGRAGDAMIPLLSGLDAATEKANRLGIVMSKQMAEDSEKFKDAMETLAASTRSLTLTVMQPLATWLATVSENMVSARVNGHALAVGFLELGKTMAAVQGFYAESFGLDRYAKAMESEFNRFDAMVKKLTAPTAAAGAGWGGGLDGAGGDRPVKVDQKRLGAALAGIKEPGAGAAARGKKELTWDEVLAKGAAKRAEVYEATERTMSEAAERGEAERIRIAESELQKWDELQGKAAAKRHEMQERAEMEGERLANQTKKTTDFAKDLGLTFESAFENAILKGEKFSEVLRGIGNDILRIIARKTVTEPIAGMVSSGLGELLKMIPSFDVGTPYVPQDMLAMVHKGEAIIPAHQNTGGGGGGTYYIDARGADRAGMDNLLAYIRSVDGSVERRAVAAVTDRNRRGGYARSMG